MVGSREVLLAFTLLEYSILSLLGGDEGVRSACYPFHDCYFHIFLSWDGKAIIFPFSLFSMISFIVWRGGAANYSITGITNVLFVGKWGGGTYLSIRRSFYVFFVGGEKPAHLSITCVLYVFCDWAGILCYGKPQKFVELDSFEGWGGSKSQTVACQNST